MKFLQMYWKRIGYSAIALISIRKYFLDSYIPVDSIGTCDGDVLKPGFYFRAPLSRAIFVVPRNFKSSESVDVMISWPGNGHHPLRVMMDEVPLKIGTTSGCDAKALNNVCIRSDSLTIVNALHDPLWRQRNRVYVSDVDRGRYLGGSLLTTKYFVAHWTHLCQLAAASASARLSNLSMSTCSSLAPDIDVAVDVLIDEMNTILLDRCGLKIDGHVAKISFQDVHIPNNQNLSIVNIEA